MVFAQVLEKFLREEALTQEVFANRVGVKQPQVSAWLLGKFMPGYLMLQKICRAFPAIPAEFWLGLCEDY